MYLLIINKIYKVNVFHVVVHVNSDRSQMTSKCGKNFYYMANSMSGQDEPNCALWLATWAGKMELSCLLGTTRHVWWEKFPQKAILIINPLLTTFFGDDWILASFSFVSLWTSTPSRFINTQKKNLANIQPSWPHTWSITHIYSYHTFASSVICREHTYSNMGCLEILSF